MRVADHVYLRAGGLRQLGTPYLHCLGKLLVREGGQRVMAVRVEPHCHATLREGSHLSSPDSGVLRIGPRAAEKPLRRPIAFRRGHLLHGQSEPMDGRRLLSPLRTRDHKREVGRPRVVRTLKALEVKRERTIERGPGEEEGRRRSQLAQDRERQDFVTGEVVVEGDRNREALSAPSSLYRLEQMLGGNDVVVPEHVVDLALEESRLVGWDELSFRIAGPLIHTVVHESDSRLATREPEQEHEAESDGHADTSGHGPRHALRERQMSDHTGHGSAVESEVVPLLERVDGFDAIGKEWDALAERSGSIFSTALWHRLWWTHFDRDRELLLHAARTANGDLTIVLPLYAWRRRLPRVLRFLGHGPGDELGPVFAGADPAVVGSALRTALERLDWDVFFGEQLPGDQRWAELLGGRTWRREASPILQLPGSWDEYLAGRSANFRQQLRRREAALSREGTVSIRLTDETTIDRDLDTLFALHRARWGSVRTDFADTSFHRELAREALARGWLRLWLLELDGRPIAAWHGFLVGSVASYYQAGRDPAYERQSVGFVLLAHSIRSAVAEGAREYRFGRGDEDFKSRFTDDDPGLDTVALARRPLGLAALTSGRSLRRVREISGRLSR